MQKKIVTPEQAYERLATQCARSEHCAHEMREKMRRWLMPASQIEAVIDRLVDERYVDDERFARAFVTDRVRFARWGRRKVRQALALKRIDRQIIAEALESVDEGEYEAIARETLHAKLRSIDKEIDPYQLRAKLFRFMAQRGFEPDLISRLLAEGE